MIKLSQGRIELYDDLENITQDRWHLFNKMLLQDSGAGSTLADIDKRHFRLDNFLKAKNFGSSIQERKNLHLSMFNTLMGLNFESLAFACLIKSINGKDVLIENDEDIERVSKEANKLVTHKEVETFVLNTKKKIANFLGYTIQADILEQEH